ncbi:MAG: RNA polymerase-associated protein RapA [Methylococcaceae bacterium]
MSKFAPGQRWVSETEPEMGLGIVLDVENNRVTVLFIAGNERRTYAVDNSPLTRVVFSRGDTLESVDGWTLNVTAIQEHAGLLRYEGLDAQGEKRTLDEMEISHFMQFNKPDDRLFTGQLDSPALFRLRYETLQHLARLEQSPIRGLQGARTSLIPHQIYIAHEVAERHAPRVLLADEVGLGKTIEAGLIMHHQLLTGRAERILVIVPEPLLYQWLVEMRRRFNLRFSLFDEERYQQIDDDNPFMAEQWVLASLDFFMEDQKLRQAVLEAPWDLCVVDEAHHLEWSSGYISPEYQFIEALSQAVPGLLLLTATPEQLGKEGHFARLRLLDPDRFYSFDTFLTEEAEYKELADMIHHLLDDPILSKGTLSQLESIVSSDLAEELLEKLDSPDSSEPARQELIQLMLDRHGTGRVLFRNTRATIKGFPGRQLIPTLLPLPPAYQAIWSNAKTLEDWLHPEVLWKTAESRSEWWRHDTRVQWMTQTVRALDHAKVLVICARAETAIDLEEALRQNGIRAAAFHEGMSIVNRDRAAAWFADQEDGADVLVCSEIGSEGRNFQFAHHLILFDLPLNPDLLEQRIGRLDRIGQTETIRIHAVCFEKTAQHTLFRWYHEGLGAFTQPCQTGQAVFSRLGEALKKALSAHPTDSTEPEESLIQTARQLTEAIQLSLQQGRDRLLELNSCRKTIADALVEQVDEADDEGSLWPYMEDVFDAYGVNIEEHSDQCYILTPGEHLRMQFPELPEDGVTITLERHIALAREDMQFLTFEHPMVRGAMDLLLNSEHGNAAFSVMSHPELSAGQLLVEVFHRVDCAAPRYLQIGRYCPPSLIRSLIDIKGTDLSALPHSRLVEQARVFDRDHAVELIRGQRQQITHCIKLAEKKAMKTLPGLIKDSAKRMLDAQTTELKRLVSLKRVNPNVRASELDQIKAHALEMNTCIQSTRIRLDAVRVIVTV